MENMETAPIRRTADDSTSATGISENIQVMKGGDGGGASNRGQTPGRSANGNRSHNNPPGTAPEKTEICMYFIRGSCRHEDKCWKVHSKLPYVWEVKEGLGWLGLPGNEQLEKEFCDPGNDCSQGFPAVNFGTMTRGSAQVRRLSTVSSVLQPTFVLTTEWTWYWKDEHGKWIQYSSSAGGHDASSVSSEALERRYQEDSSAIVQFTAGAQSYQISFKDMVQTNVRYGTRRAVRRRPVFVSSAEAQTIKTRKKLPAAGMSNFKALPGHWDKSLVPETGFKRISLQLSSDECRQIVTLFGKTMRGFRIHQIERVQNKSLWEVFQWQKDLMRKRNAGRNVTERQLFHGTDSKHVDAICQQNFDWRICGTHGTAYGKGSYFARDAKYSHSYTGSSGMRTMFVCWVLVGCYTKGNSSYLRPPSKDGGDSVFYDSCVDEIHDPSIFVVFEKHQVYPEYLIQYSGSEWIPQCTHTPRPNHSQCTTPVNGTHRQTSIAQPSQIQGPAPALPTQIQTVTVSFHKSSC
ncbi:hypothetical protein GJAV_G00269760 [Gymnothorax javanicus]|nr:hypothetical protein GJAV_G00269760 [Gymnothorax javanicus]